MLTIEDYKNWLHDCLTIGIPALSLDTSARILACVCVLGNNENIVMSPQCKADLEYIQSRFGINGGEIPDSDIINPLKEYITELEKAKEVPKWAEKIFKERYGIKLYI